MAQKNPHVSPVGSPESGSHQSTLDHPPDTLALLVAQVANITARLDSQSAEGAVAAAGANPHPPVAQRRHDAPLERAYPIRFTLLSKNILFRK